MLAGICDRERQTEIETERDRQTDRQTDRERHSAILKQRRLGFAVAEVLQL